MLKRFAAVLKTELKLATRNPDMILFGIVMPVGVMLLLGLVSRPDAVALDFGGVVCFGLCASGLMGLPLTISDYRHRKVLRRFRVTPASPGLLLGAQAVVQCAYVLVSAVAVFLIARLAFGVRIEGGAGRFLGSFLLTQAALYGVGLLVGSLSPNAKIANAAASLLYFPMIFLSGATIPFEILPRPVQIAAQVLPATQGIKLLKAAIAGSSTEGLLLPVITLSALSLVAYTISIRFFKWE